MTQPVPAPRRRPGALLLSVATAAGLVLGLSAPSASPAAPDAPRTAPEGDSRAGGRG